MSKEVPEPWASAMVARGFVHHERPSSSALARKAGLANETVRRMVLGIGTPEQVNVSRVADALGVARVKVSGWCGVRRDIEESYEPPTNADLMNREERDAVSRIIQLFVDERKAGGEHEHSSAPMKDELERRRGNKYLDAATTEVTAARDEDQDD